MRELRPGVWHWKSPHPDWDEEQWWPELVSSYAIEIDGDLLLFDPLDRVRGMESEDLSWLRAGEGRAEFHRPGRWPFGIEAYAGREENDLILWIPAIRAVVTGDSLSDFGEGLDIQLGGRTHVTRAEVVGRLWSLLQFPIALVLPAHGGPADRAALERALT